MTTVHVAQIPSDTLSRLSNSTSTRLPNVRLDMMLTFNVDRDGILPPQFIGIDRHYQNVLCGNVLWTWVSTLFKDLGRAERTQHNPLLPKPSSRRRRHQPFTTQLQPHTDMLFRRGKNNPPRFLEPSAEGLTGDWKLASHLSSFSWEPRRSAKGSCESCWRLGRQKHNSAEENVEKWYNAERKLDRGHGRLQHGCRSWRQCRNGPTLIHDGPGIRRTSDDDGLGQVSWDKEQVRPPQPLDYYLSALVGSDPGLTEPSKRSDSTLTSGKQSLGVLANNNTRQEEALPWAFPSMGLAMMFSGPCPNY